MSSKISPIRFLAVPVTCLLFALCLEAFSANKADELKVQNLNNSAASSIMKGEYHSALESLNQASKIDPNNVMVMQNKCEVFFHLHDYNLLITEFEKLQKRSIRGTTLDPHWAGQVYAAQGLERQKAGDKKGALESFEKANLYYPKVKEYLRYRGEARQAMGDAKGAKEDFAAAEHAPSISSFPKG